VKERALKLSGGKPLDRGTRRSEELMKMRTINLPEFKKGGYSSADFNLLWSGGALADAAFVKGDEALRPAVALLKKASPAQPLPDGSKAKVVRRGVLACSDIIKSCQMVLMYPQDAVSAQGAPITVEKK
jgi:hypothetical protein